MNTKSIKKFISGLLASAACITSISLSSVNSLKANAEAGRYIADGVYCIRNLNSGKYMDINWARTADGTEVIQYGFHGDLNQQFKVTRESDGYYSIKPMHCQSSALDLRSVSGANSNGTDAQIRTFRNYTEQKFTITNAVGGGFQIGTAASGGRKVLEVTNSSHNDCEIIQIWDYSTSRMNDNWAFERVSPANMSYYTLTNLSSGDQNDANAIVKSFNALGYNADQYQYPTTSTVKNNAYNSSVLVFHGHGNTGFVRVHKNAKNDTLYDLYSEKAPSGAQNLGTVIPSSTWKHTSLVYFATCNSAASNSSRKSMIQSAYDLGATCAIGFRGSVAGGEDFLRYMMNAVEADPDITIRTAINRAVDEFIRTRGKSTLTDSASPANSSNRVVLGNQDITLKKR